MKKSKMVNIDKKKESIKRNETILYCKKEKKEKERE